VLEMPSFSTASGHPATGRLLVATQELIDPNFRDAVVLLLDHDADGTLGVILNRPTPILVASVLGGWASAAEPPEVLFEGGPVKKDSALALAEVRTSDPLGVDPTSTDPLGFRRLFGDVGIIDLDTPAEVLGPALHRLRIFAGYAGWSPGQLENEIEQDSWYVVDGLPEDVFGAHPARLRADILRRQPGELAWVATRPEDAAMN
jgi:putative transcriptional regulator